MQYIPGNPYIDSNTGILGAQGAASTQGGILGAAPQASGGWFGNDPGAAPSAMHGGLGPLLGNQKAALAFSGLQDALSSFGGGEPTHAMAAQMEQLKDNRKLSLRQLAAQRLQDAKTPEDRNSALVDYFAGGGDPSELVAAYKAGAPVWHEVGRGGTGIKTDPITGEETGRVQGQPAAPIIRKIDDGPNIRTVQVDPDTGTMTTIGVSPRFKAATPKAAGGVPGGNPSGLFKPRGS